MTKLKPVTILIAVILLALLVACGEQPTPAPTVAPTAEPPTTEAPTEAPPAEPPPTEAPTNTPPPAEPAASFTSGTPEQLRDIVWQWQAFQDPSGQNSVELAMPQNYTAVFLSNDEVMILADCNNVLGTYSAAESSLSIQLGPSTMAFCGEASLDQQFLTYLAAAATYGFTDDGRLVINLIADGGNMFFLNGGPADIQVSPLTIDPRDIAIDPSPLNESWQAAVMPATPYDESMPPGPMGMPDHIQIFFGYSERAERPAGGPIMYVVPVSAYEALWQDAGNESVTQRVDQIFANIVGLPQHSPSSLATLPMSEERAGVNDIAVQIAAVESAENSASKDGYRFVGRWSQGPNPVTNQDLWYTYQGFTNDGRYAVSYWHPVTTSALPADAGQVSEEEFNQLTADMNAYLAAKTEELNAIPADQWEPNLETLDAVVASLEISGIPRAGLPGILWSAGVNSPDGLTETAIDPDQDIVVVFNGDGTLNYVADCNVGSGVYDATEGMIGTLATQLGPTTLAECGPESQGPVLVDTLAVAQEWHVLPGGALMQLIRPAGGGYLQFDFLGRTEPIGSDEEVELPEPEPEGPTGTVIAPAGVNVRTGPGSVYPILGVASYGTTGEIIGRSADRQWWVASVPAAPNGQGWVAANFVEATGAENVPVIPAPPPPATPVPTATPTPTATPSPSITFTADQTTINQGECTTLRWSVANVQAAWVYPLGLPYNQFPVTGEGSQQVCPSFTTTYELRVLRVDGAIELRQITINVRAGNPLPGTSWAVSTLQVNQLPIPGTSLTLAFDATGTASGSSGCNTFNGPYASNQSSITIGPLAVTGIACADDVSAQEALYLQLLQSAATFQVNGNTLILRDATGQEILRFFRTG